MRVTHSASFPDPALREARRTPATGAEFQTMNAGGGSVADARNAKAGKRFGARVRTTGLCFLMLALAALWPQGASAEGETPVRTEVASPSRVAALYAYLPLSFEINQGQIDPRVKYLAHGPGYTLWLTADQAVLALGSSAQPSTTPLPVVRLGLVGSDAAPRVWGEQPLHGESNYFLGNNPQAWHTGIPTFGQVRYANVYRGVDLVYYGHQGELEYDFVVQPGADPRSIQFAINSDEPVGSQQKAVGSEMGPQRQSAIDNGQSSIPAPLRIDGNGDLVVGIEGGQVIFHKPLVYQPGTNYEPTSNNQEPRTTHKKVIDGHY